MPTLRKRKLQPTSNHTPTTIDPQSNKRSTRSAKSTDSTTSCVVLKSNLRQLNRKSIENTTKDFNRSIVKKNVHGKALPPTASSVLRKLYDKDSVDCIRTAIDQLFDLNPKSIRLQIPSILHVIFQLLVNAAGCEAILSAKNIMTDDYESVFGEIGHRFPADIGHLYPIVGTDKKYKYFKDNLNKLVIIFCKKCETSQLIFNYDFTYHLISFVNCMSNSNIRTFRHTATFFGMKMFTCVGVLMNDYIGVGNEFAVERKTLHSVIERLFSGIFVHRSRDIIADIRSLCVYQLGICINKNKAHFLNSSYLKYIGMALCDKTAAVRINAIVIIKSLVAELSFSSFQQIDTQPSSENCIQVFLARFQPRLISLICDPNSNIALSALDLLCLLVENGLYTIEWAEKDSNVMVDAITQLLISLPCVKLRNKFEKILAKLFYLIVVNYTVSRDISKSDFSELVENFSLDHNGELILNSIAAFCAATTITNDQLNRESHENFLNLIFASNLSSIVTNVDLVVGVLLQSPDFEIIHLSLLSYNIIHYDHQLSTLREIFDVYMKNLVQKFQTEPFHFEIVLDIIKGAVDQYSNLVVNSNAPFMDSSDYSTTENNRQTHKNVFQKLCALLKDTFRLIPTESLNNYNKVVEIFQLIDEKFAGLFGEQLGLSAVKEEFEQIDNVLTECFNPFNLSVEFDSELIENCFCQSTLNYLLKYNALLQGFSPYVLQNPRNDVYGLSSSSSSIEVFLSLLSSVFGKEAQILPLLTHQTSQQILSSLYTSVLLWIMWALLNESGNDADLFEKQNLSTAAMPHMDTRKLVDSFNDFVSQLWTTDDRKYRHTHAHLYHDIFKVVRDLCLLLRVFDSYSTSHHSLLTLQKNYIINLIEESNCSDDSENYRVKESNFRGFIEYINYSLLDSEELAYLFFKLLTKQQQQQNSAIELCKIVEQVLTAYLQSNIEQFFHKIAPGLLKTMYKRCVSCDRTLSDDTFQPGLELIQRCASLLANAIPASSTKNEEYRRHMKLFLCESIDYSLKEDLDKHHPSISFLWCFTPFLTKTVDVDRLGKYGLLNYFNDKLKKSSYKKKRCPIVSKFRAALNGLKIYPPPDSLPNASAESPLSSFKVCPQEVSNFLNTYVNDDDCSNLTICFDDPIDSTDPGDPTQKKSVILDSSGSDLDIITEN